MANEPEHLGWLIKRVQHRHHRELDAQLVPLDISLVQWNALREIARNTNVSQHHLAEQTFNSDQAFGTLLKRLLARELIEQHDSAGRAAFHRLTAKGEQLLRDGQVVMSKLITEPFAVLGVKERTQLARLLTKVLDARDSRREQ